MNKISSKHEQNFQGILTKIPEKHEQNFQGKHTLHTVLEASSLPEMRLCSNQLCPSAALEQSLLAVKPTDILQSHPFLQLESSFLTCYAMPSTYPLAARQ